MVKFLKLPEVIARTGKSRSSIYAAIKEGYFPKQVKLGPRAVGWIEAEVEAYNQTCIDTSRSGDSE
jgi:prophage regulatory protein